MQSESVDDASENRRGSPLRPVRIQWLVVLALCAVPMTLVPSTPGVTVVTLWGFLTVDTAAAGLDISGYPVWRYFLDQPRPFDTLPASIQAWPLAVGFHVLAAGSATSGVILRREDRRLTGGLLVLAAVASLWVSVGVATRFGVGSTTGWFSVLPIGALVTLAVVGVGYRHDLRRIVVP